MDRRPWRFALALILATGAGCGSGSSGVAVSGRASFAGAPIRDGTISFIPIDGTAGPSSGGAIRDGSYAIGRDLGPYPGRYRVEILAFEDVKPATAKEMAGSLFGMDESAFGAASAPQMTRRNVIPSRFNETSTLTATVPEARSSEAHFDLPR